MVDKNGNIKRAKTSEPRYISGELVLYQKKIVEYETFYIYSDVEKKNKRIKKDDWISYMNIGWLKGKKKEYVGKS
jgi:hypothetical protein